MHLKILSSFSVKGIVNSRPDLSTIITYEVAVKYVSIVHEMFSTQRLMSSSECAKLIAYQLNARTIWDIECKETEKRKDEFLILIDGIDYKIRVAEIDEFIVIYVLDDKEDTLNTDKLDDTYLKVLANLAQTLKSSHIGNYSDDDYYDLASQIMITSNDKELDTKNKIKLIFNQIIPNKFEFGINCLTLPNKALIVDSSSNVILEITDY